MPQVSHQNYALSHGSIGYGYYQPQQQAAVLDGLVGVTDGKASGGAGRVGGNHAARKPKGHADVHGAGLRHGLDVGGSRNFRTKTEDYGKGVEV